MEIQNLRKSSIYNHDKKNDQFQHVRFHGLIVQVLFGIDTFTVQLNQNIRKSGIYSITMIKK